MSIPFHISNFKFLTENHPDILRSDRNGNQEADRLSVRFLGDQLGGSEGVASIPASIFDEKQNGLGVGRVRSGP
jgi:hypothetical protein